MSSKLNILDLARQTFVDLAIEELACQHRARQLLEGKEPCGPARAREPGGAAGAAAPEGGSPAPNVGDLIQDAATLGLHNLRALTRMHHVYSDFIVDRVMGRSSGTRGGGPAQERRREPVLLAITARPGERARTRFLLCNAHARQAQVSFLTSEFGEQGSQSGFQKIIQFDPPRPQIGPGQEVVVALSVEIDKSFVPGHCYRCRINAVMDDEDTRSFLLDIAVEEGPVTAKPETKPEIEVVVEVEPDVVPKPDVTPGER